jgi:tetratricopeptide (TPR) repeat protein
MPIDISNAVELQAQGRLDEAAKIYRAVLAADPENAEALHLLGVVSLQQGDCRAACELIERAIQHQPGNSAYFSNLAEAYRAGGQLERALDYCRKALALDPDCVEAANNLGLTLLAQGDAASAIPQFQAALKIRPNLAILHNNLGNALRLNGQISEAIASFRRGLDLDPQLAESHSNLGQLLLERYDRDKALFHCREAVRLCPEMPEAHNNLGNVLRDIGQLKEAQECYLEALRLDPEQALTHSNMGQALQEEGNLQEAIQWYQAALARDPSSPRILCNFASALEEQENFEAAVAQYRKAVEQDATFAEAHNGLGFVLHEQGNYSEALAEYREVLRLKPDFATGLCNLGNILEELGSADEAEAAYREALNRDSNHAGAYSLLATMLGRRLPVEDQQAIYGLLARPRMALAKRAALHFGIAHVLDGTGVYEKAAEHLREGNSLCLKLWARQGKSYDPQAHTSMVDGLMAAFNADFFAHVPGFGVEGDVPVFIIGLPRSGTTLTEQILSSHSRVHGAGELNFARDDMQWLPSLLGRSGTPIECVPHLSHEAASRLGQWHLDRLRQLAPDALRVVDKMPDNYLFLGLLACLFPRARFIHCRRDLRDVAVSCWMTNFRNIRWSADPDQIAARFQDYQKLMAHWRAVLPVPLLEVDYEETVLDLENVARKLVDWCGLEWEPACLAFHQSSRPIRTASVQQVRQPVYKHSVARWKNYEKDLGSLFEQIQS